MIFTLFDRSALYQIMAGDTSGKFDYYAKEGDAYTLDNNTADPWAWAAQGVNVADGLQTTKKHAEYMDSIGSHYDASHIE